MEKLRKYSLLLFFATTGLIIPKISFAAWTDDLAEKIFGNAIYGILWLAAYAVSFSAEMSGKLLNWVLSPDFLNGISYTNPTTNPIIKTGLSITQSLVNMILVLVLIYIALATILRLKEYQAQKLLPTFIIIALLVNFTPVICGIIVDASNILMNFFVERIHADRFGDLVKANLDNVQIGVEQTSTKESAAWDKAVQLLFLIPFMAMLTFIMLVFSLIFALRYMAIWMLVILSPIAFVAFILPVTKKWWSMWWSQFINWCFIGVTLAFFLYLSLFFIISVPSKPPAGSMPSIASEGFIQTLGLLTGVVFLGIGLVFGLKTSAMGAATVISFASAKGRQYGIEPAKRLTRGVAKIPAGVTRAATRGAYRRLGGERAIGAVADKLARAGARTPFLKWVMPDRLRDAGNLRPSIEKAEQAAKNESGATSAARILTKTDVGTVATGRLVKLLKGNDAQDLFNEAKKIGSWKKLNRETNKIEPMSDEEILTTKKFQNIIAPILKNAQSAGMLGTIVRRDPRLAKVAAAYNIGSYARFTDKNGNPITEESRRRKAAVSKAVNEARAHINDWEPEEIEDRDVLGAVLANFEEDRLLQLNRSVKNGQKTFLETGDKDFSDFVRTKSKFKGMKDAERKRILSPIKRTDEKTGKVITEYTREYEEVWEEYRKEKEKEYGGDMGFRALESNRVKDRGYRRFELVGEEKKKEDAPTGAVPSATPGTTPAGAAGMGTPPTPTTPPSGIPTTGIGGQKKKDIPTTGKGGKKKPYKGVNKP